MEVGIDLLTIILEWGTTPSADNPLHTQLEFLEPDEFLKLKELLQVGINATVLIVSHCKFCQWEVGDEGVDGTVLGYYIDFEFFV